MNTVQSTSTGGHTGSKKSQQEEELAVSSPGERNWRGIFIALLVIAAVLGLIVFSIILVSPAEECPRKKGTKPTLEDIFVTPPPPPQFNGTWVSESEFVFHDRYGGISLFNADNTSAMPLMNNITMRQHSVEDFLVANNLKHVLLLNEKIGVYEHTNTAKYHIYDVSTRSVKPLSPKELDDNAPPLQYATWSHDGNAIAFVHNNDIYYKPKVEKDLVCRITNTGKFNTIFNGVPDWLYEHEILKTSYALWFSPDSTYLLFLRFNDTNVNDYKYFWYNKDNSNNVQIKSFHHPTVETPNPDVSVWIVDLTKPKYLFPMELKPTASVQPGSYLTNVKFHGDGDVSIIWLNREQTSFVVVICRNSKHHLCEDFHIETQSNNIGWIEPIYNIIFNENRSKALITLPMKYGDKGHYMHVCLIDNNSLVQLSYGSFEIAQMLAWDEMNFYIYALGTIANHTDHRHLLRIEQREKGTPSCLTCSPTMEAAYNFSTTESFDEAEQDENMWKNYRCDYNNVIFSKAAAYYAQECLGPDIPILILMKTYPNVRISVLDAGRVLRKKISQLTAPQEKSLSVEIGNYKAQVKMYLPAILREYEETTFPLVLLVDASPSSQLITAKWDLTWTWFLANTRNYIVAKIDARGSGFQSMEMRREIQRRIGLIEVQDQLNVLTHLVKQYKYIDREKICVVGKGYGGFVAAMMLAQDINQTINCSVSISPISNWRNYNTFYAEKYLGLPSKHPLEYDNADLIMKAGKIKDRNFMLIYGTADTRIPAYHSIVFAKELIKEEVLFHQLAYPDESHNFDKKALIHMYKEIDVFLNDSFGPIIDEWVDNTGFFI